MVTLGGRVAYAVRGKEGVRVPGRMVDVVDTIGSGGAFTAAFVAGWLSGKSLEDCSTFGSTLGALAARTKGATAPITVDEINRFCLRTI